MTVTQTDVATLINSYLQKEHLVPTGSAPVPGDTDLLESKILDSLSLVKLVVSMEEELGIRIPLEDIVPRNFATVSGMASYLASHLNPRS